MRQVNIGMIGAGTVGRGVFHHWQQNGALMSSRLGVQLAITKVAVRVYDEKRHSDIPRRIVTTDWKEVVNDPDIHIVIELIGGTSLAKEIVLTALKLGKPVITANKALLSAHGEELFAAAKANNANLYYEASVAGGIPVIKTIREALVGNRFTHIYGIVNGTCNYILTRMKQEGAEFADVLADAQRLGYAETPPDLDIDGFDAAHKTGILASLAHGFWIRPKQVHVEGIRSISKLDMKFAQQLGYTIRLLGIVKILPLAKGKNGKLETKSGNQVQVSVYPALVPNAHVLANVNGVFNAIFIRGDAVGDTLFYGRGAGKDATASAVLSDMGDAALDRAQGTTRVPPFTPHDCKGCVAPIGDVVSRYYVRLSVVDKPGVMAKVTAILGAAKIGIASVIQPEDHEGESVPLILMIHEAPNKTMEKALAKIAKLAVVKSKPVIIRVESFQ